MFFNAFKEAIKNMRDRLSDKNAIKLTVAAAFLDVQDNARLAALDLAQATCGQKTCKLPPRFLLE